MPALPTTLPVTDLTGLCRSVTTDLPVVGRVTTVLWAPHVRTTDLVREVRGLTRRRRSRPFVAGVLTAAAGV